MRNRLLLVLMTLATLSACLRIEHPQSASGETAGPTHQASVLGQPEARPLEAVSLANFERDIAPIFSSRCQPCHFPGGKMYQRLPFDQAATIRKLGPRLFSRIKDEGERARIQAFLDGAQTPPQTPSKPSMP